MNEKLKHVPLASWRDAVAALTARLGEGATALLVSTIDGHTAGCLAPQKVRERLADYARFAEQMSTVPTRPTLERDSWKIASVIADSMYKHFRPEETTG